MKKKGGREGGREGGRVNTHIQHNRSKVIQHSHTRAIHEGAPPPLAKPCSNRDASCTLNTKR